MNHGVKDLCEVGRMRLGEKALELFADGDTMGMWAGHCRGGNGRVESGCRFAVTVQEVWAWGRLSSIKVCVYVVLKMKVRTADGGNCNVLIVEHRITYKYQAYET